MNTHAHKSAYRVGLTLAIAALAGTAMASEPKSEDADLLRGPEVVTSTDSRGSDSMSEMSEKPDAEKQIKEKANKLDQLPFQAFVNAVHGLKRAARQNPELALTDEQTQQIDAIAESHHAEMEAFLKEHHDEIAQYRGQLPPAPPPGQGGEQDGMDRGEHGTTPPAPPSEEDKIEAQRREVQRQLDASMSPIERKENMEKLRKLMESAPSDASAKRQIWALLSADQKQSVKDTITKIAAHRERTANMAVGRRGARAEAPEGQASKRRSRDQKSRKDARRSNKEPNDGDD